MAKSREFRRLDVVRCTKGLLWQVLADPKDGMMRVANVNQPTTAYLAPVEEFTLEPGVHRLI